MTTLVTGGTGLVGYHVLTALIGRGERPLALVRDLDKGRRLLPDECELVRGDLTDPASLSAAFEDVDRVFHAAGLPEQWLPDDATFERVNVGGTRNIIAACRAAGVGRLIYTSTIDVFEGSRGETFDESVIATYDKETPYERSKQGADRLVSAAVADGLDAVFIHPAAVYGPGPTSSRGINDFVRDLRDGKAPSLLPGGMPVVFAADLGEAQVRAAERAAPGARFIVSERFVSLRDLAVAACAALGGKRVPPVAPLFIARGISAATEAYAKLTGTPPLIPKGQLHFMQWGAIPDASRASRELDMQWTPLEAGLEALVRSLA